jgi:hypothetical protein
MTPQRWGNDEVRATEIIIINDVSVQFRTREAGFCGKSKTGTLWLVPVFSEGILIDLDPVLESYASAGAGDGSRISSPSASAELTALRIGCFFMYVRLRHTHSNGPNLK